MSLPLQIEFKATFETKVQMLWKILEKAAEQLADAGERLRTLPEDLDRRFDLEDFVEGRIDWLKEDFDGALEVGSAPVEQEIHWQESPGGAVSTLLAALWKPPAPANGVRTEAFKATFETKDVLTMIAMTADPAGDVSQRARSGLIAAVSKHTFSSFMNDFSNITQEAFTAQSTDSFYAARGVRLQSLEMTRYEMVDQETANILQLIIQESTNRINQLQQQESENDVKAAKLVADIDLEKKKTSLITTQAANEKLQASLQGQAAGTELVESAVAFIDGLTDTVTDVADRTALYRLHQLLDARNVDTNNLATGQAQLFLTPSTLNLQLRMANQEL